jgi:hypothetical protein
MTSLSDYCADLGCPLKNVRCSWCAVSEDRTRAVFTVWADEVKDRKFVLFPITDRRLGEIPDDANQKTGARELLEVASYCGDNPEVEVFGVLCVAEDPNARPRVRKHFDDETVFKVRVVSDGERIVAHLVARLPIDSVVRR